MMLGYNMEMPNGDSAPPSKAHASPSVRLVLSPSQFRQNEPTCNRSKTSNRRSALPPLRTENLPSSNSELRTPNFELFFQPPSPLLFSLRACVPPCLRASP